MTDDRIKSAIHNCIKTYELTSKSKRFSKITFENEAKIIESINKNHKEKFMDTLSKRDYYAGKINKLLNDSITDDDSSNMKLKNQANGPDPRYITNRYHAKQYVINSIMSNEVKVKKIKDVIGKHFALQDDYKISRDTILKKHDDSIKNLKPNTSLSKLSSTNAQIKNHTVNSKNAQLNHEIEILNDKIIFNSKQYVIETHEILQSMKIPFFYIDEVYKYPQLDEDKKFMLDLLVELIAGKTAT